MQSRLSFSHTGTGDESLREIQMLLAARSRFDKRRRHSLAHLAVKPTPNRLRALSAL
jgi:hypothetical protein